MNVRTGRILPLFLAVAASCSEKTASYDAQEDVDHRGAIGDRAAAEDVAQEAFARLLARDVLPPVDAERWVFKVGRNLAISRLRSVKKLLPLTEAEAFEGWSEGSELERRALLLKEAVGALPARRLIF